MLRATGTVVTMRYMTLRFLVLAPALLVGTTTCDTMKISAPKAPLALSVSVRTLDGSTLPARIAEQSGAASYLTAYTFTLTPDGFWRGKGTRYPEGVSPSNASEIWDNGTYQFDGTSLVLHSNFSHTDWPSTVRGDTISAMIVLPIGDTPYAVVMW